MADQTNNQTDAIPDNSGPVGHIIPVRALIGVCAALLILTGITVTVSYFDLGNWNLWAALGIAGLKAMLVALFFMHLRYDRPFNSILLIGALLFLMLFIGVTLMDRTHYQKYIYPVESPDYAPRIESQHQRS